MRMQSYCRLEFCPFHLKKCHYVDKGTYFLQNNQLPNLTTATSFSLAHAPPPRTLVIPVMQRNSAFTTCTRLPYPLKSLFPLCRPGCSGPFIGLFILSLGSVMNLFPSFMLPSLCPKLSPQHSFHLV